MTKVLNIRKMSRNSRVPEKPRDHVSVEDSIDVTLSMSHTSNHEGVSWSSSDGSTYYSDDDEVSLQQRRRKHRSEKVDEDHERGYTNYRGRVEGTKYAIKDINLSAADSGRESLLKNVVSFPEIDVATSSEDLSAVGFLTTEDTAKVFCTSKIPFEVTTKKKLRKGVSALSVASTEVSSHVFSSMKSDVAVRYQPVCDTDSTKSDIGSVKCEKAVSQESSVPSTDGHSVDAISLTNEEPISPLECAPTWDDLSLGSDGSKDAHVSDGRLNDTLQQGPEPLPLLQIESKVKKIKQMEKERSELKTEERIKQLKQKIRSMQDMSKRSIDNSSTCTESFLSKSAAPQESTDLTSATSVPLIEKCESNESKQKEKPVSFKNKDIQDSNEHDETFEDNLLGGSVPLVIPIMEDEEVSDIGFHMDIESGHLCQQQKVDNKFLLSTIERTKLVLVETKARVLAVCAQIRPIVAKMKMEFHQRPKNEQIIMIAIGVLSVVFFLLLTIMMAQ